MTSHPLTCFSPPQGATLPQARTKTLSLRLTFRSLPGTAAVLLAALWPLAGAAAEAPEADRQTPEPVAAATAPKVDCTCRYRGEDFHLGQSICLKGPSGPRMAVCTMILNNTSWQATDAPCPSAVLPSSESTFYGTL